MQDISKFIKCFRRFQNDYLCGSRELFDQLVSGGQHPQALLVTCCDSRLNPFWLTDSSIGEMFIVRTVANLVPHYQSLGGLHGVSAALEFAVQRLGIEHIIVLGHSGCGGIRALMDDDPVTAGGEFIGPWVELASAARDQVKASLGEKPRALQERACEQAALLLSLENLMTFPWIRSRVEKGELTLHAWYFDMEAVALHGYCAEKGRFEPLVEGCRVPPPDSKKSGASTTC